VLCVHLILTTTSTTTECMAWQRAPHSVQHAATRHHGFTGSAQRCTGPPQSSCLELSASTDQAHSSSSSGTQAQAQGAHCCIGSKTGRCYNTASSSKGATWARCSSAPPSCSAHGVCLCTALLQSAAQKRAVARGSARRERRCCAVSCCCDCSGLRCTHQQSVQAYH
jgi:hypothetical protein